MKERKVNVLKSEDELRLSSGKIYKVDKRKNKRFLKSLKMNI